MIEQSNVEDPEQKALLAFCFHVGFLLGVLLVPEDGGCVSSKRYVPEDSTLPSHRRENLRSCTKAV